MFPLNTLLTEFDESISSKLNADPLGLLVMWPSYRQDIFRRRISSISSDVPTTRSIYSIMWGFDRLLKMMVWF